jgi:peptidoglycan/LPS O-acetylase OafA/YrhL
VTARAPWQPIVTILAMLVFYQGMEVWGHQYRDTVVRTVLPPLAAILVFQLVVLHGSGLWSWLESAPMRWMGRISYGLCLFHGLAFGTVKRQLGAWPIGVQFMVLLMATVAIASLSYLLLERPFLERKHAGLRVRGEALPER